jgi:MFS family permease
MALLRALRTRPFALLWSGQVVSRFGDSVHAIALAWVVLELTGSAAAMGVVLAANIVTFIVFSLAGGVVVDRLPRLRVMIASDLARMTIVIGVALLIVADRLEFWHLVVLSGAFGIVDAFFHPAYTAAIPDLVVGDDRSSANSLTHLSRRLARLVGPAVGATLVATGGTAAAFAIDSLSFALSALLVYLAARAAPAPFAARAGPGPQLSAVTADSGVTAVEHPSSEVDAVAQPRWTTTPSPGALAELREGITAVTSQPLLWVAIAMAGITGITLTGPQEAALPLLVSEHLRGDVGTLGLIQTMIAIGAIGGAVFLGSRTRLRRRGPVLYVGWAASALGMSVIGLPVGVPGAVLGALVLGAGAAFVSLNWSSTLQELVPSERLGRVSAVDHLGSSALEPIGFVAAGSAADTFGPATVFVAGGLLSAGILVSALLHPAIRRFD